MGVKWYLTVVLIPEPRVLRGSGLWDIQDVIKEVLSQPSSAVLGDLWPKWNPGSSSHQLCGSGHVPAALFPGHRMATQGQGAEMSVLMEGPYLGHWAQPGPAPGDSRPARLDSGCLAMGRSSVSMAAKGSGSYLGAVASGKYLAWFCSAWTSPTFWASSPESLQGPFPDCSSSADRPRLFPSSSVWRCVFLLCSVIFLPGTNCSLLLCACLITCLTSFILL